MRTRGKLRLYLSIFLAFALIGIWHGPSLNWVIFGAFNGLSLVAYRLMKEEMNLLDRIPSFVRRVLGVGWLVLFCSILGALHSSDSMAKVQGALASLSVGWTEFSDVVDAIIYCVPFVLPLIVYEWFQERAENYDMIERAPFFLKLAWCAVSLAAIFFMDRSETLGFIYFQF